MINVAAASLLARLWANRRKSMVSATLALAVVAGMCLSVYATTIFATASHHNYPGAAPAVLPSSKQNEVSFGYFDPENIFTDDQNK